MNNLLLRRRMMFPTNKYYCSMVFAISANTAKTVSVSAYYLSKTNVFIEWGDGCTEHIIASTAKTLSHTYAVNESARYMYVKIVSSVSLTSLYCNGNALTALDVSNNPHLTVLQCHSNALTTLDVSSNPLLTSLYCNNNALTTLDVSSNHQLTMLQCQSNALSALDVSNNPHLTVLQCHSNALTTLDVSSNPLLTSLYCNNNALTTLDVSSNHQLTMLQCQSNALSVLDVSNNPQLTTLYCQSNALTILDISSSPKLTNLYCWNNALTSLDISYNPQLEELLCYSNPFTKVENDTNTPILQKIGGIDGYTRSIRNYQLGKVAGNYDLTNYSFKTDTCDLALNTDGIVDVNESINRKHLYSTSWINNGINSWSIKASQVRVHTVDGNIISDKKSFYDRIASIVAKENLYDYPQLCKIHTPTFDLKQTRDNYATHKILLCDSGNNSLWQNGRGTFGVETPTNFITWVPTKDILKNYVTTPVFYCRVVVSPNATFYITVISSRYYAYDKKQRAICNDGELSVTNGAEIISNSYNSLTNQTEYIIKFDILNPANASYYGHHFYLYEDKYPTAADPYETRILSFEEVKE